MIYGCARHTMVSAAARPVARFIRSADDVVTVLGLHSDAAHEARFLSIREGANSVSPPPGHGNGKGPLPSGG